MSIAFDNPRKIFKRLPPVMLAFVRGAVGSQEVLVDNDIVFDEYAGFFVLVTQTVGEFHGSIEFCRIVDQRAARFI